MPPPIDLPFDLHNSVPSVGTLDSKRQSSLLNLPLSQASQISSPLIPPKAVTPNSSKNSIFSGLAKRKNSKPTVELTVEERKEKIKKYLEKRKRRIWDRKISYDCRRKVADKRLRIKGRFVTREQAYAALGTTQEDFIKNKNLVNLIKANSDCSIVTSAKNVKVRNIQTLIGPEAGKNFEDPESEKKLKVEIIKTDPKNQVVEIKIEQSPETNTVKTPKSTVPIFTYKKVQKNDISK